MPIQRAEAGHYWPPPDDHQFRAEQCAQHVKAGVGKVQNAHHRKDERQTSRQHKQEQTRYKTVYEIDKDEIHVGQSLINLNAAEQQNFKGLTPALWI